MDRSEGFDLPLFAAAAGVARPAKALSAHDGPTVYCEDPADPLYIPPILRKPYTPWTPAAGAPARCRAAPTMPDARAAKAARNLRLNALADQITAATREGATTESALRARLPDLTSHDLKAGLDRIRARARFAQLRAEKE